MTNKAIGILDLYGEPAFPILQHENSSYISTLETIKASQDSNSEGIIFTEIMEGFMTDKEDVESFTVATNAGQGGANTARFFLSVHSYNTDIRKCPLVTQIFYCYKINVV